MFDFGQILMAFDLRIEELNEKRREEEEPPYPKVEILLLGQMGLFAHPDHLQGRLHLVGTVDVDAILKGRYSLTTVFEEVLKQHGLRYDRDSHLVWIPPESTRTAIFETSRVKCEVLDPLYVLTSKAVKAKEKNRLLIREALAVYGRELEALIQKHGGDLEFFGSQGTS